MLSYIWCLFGNVTSIVKQLGLYILVDFLFFTIPKAPDLKILPYRPQLCVFWRPFKDLDPFYTRTDPNGSIPTNGSSTDRLSVRPRLAGSVPIWVCYLVPFGIAFQSVLIWIRFPSGL